MEEITQDDVIQILSMLEKSEFDELRLEMGDLKLIVNKSGKGSVSVLEKESATEDPEPSTALQKPAGEEKDPEISTKPSADPEALGLVPIKAPMLGTFYRSPKPGAPPFVEAGQNVTKDNTVCIIEVMKLFNTIKAGIQGRIEKICADNAQMVEYNQVLFLVKPTAD
jgi:acetyl-CoA carboxylase biotin carboxyl carrier protein